MDENKNQSDKPPDIIKENQKNSENMPLKLIKSEDNGKFPLFYEHLRIQVFISKCVC